MVSTVAGVPLRITYQKYCVVYYFLLARIPGTDWYESSIQNAAVISSYALCVLFDLRATLCGSG